MRPSLTFWLVLAAICAAFLFLATPKTGSRTVVRDSATQFDLAAFKTAINQFEIDTGQYPAGSNGLLQLLHQPTGETNWHGPYLDKMPKDPWNHDYVYQCPGKHNPDSFDLFSVGPDGRAGTDDDIVNWKQ